MRPAVEGSFLPRAVAARMMMNLSTTLIRTCMDLLTTHSMNGAITGCFFLISRISLSWCRILIKDRTIR